MPRESRPDIADGLHARFHHAFLQLRGDGVDTLGRIEQRGFLRLAGELHNLIAREHQFADQIHQLIQLTDVHANGGVGNRRCRPGGRLLFHHHFFLLPPDFRLYSRLG